VLRWTAATLVLAVFLLISGPTVTRAGITSGARPGQQGQLADLKARGDREIGIRLDTLSQLSREIASSRSLDRGDRALLTTLVSSTRQGLQRLRAAMQAASDPESVRADIEAIVGFRVLALLVPQAHALAAADGVLAYCANRFPVIQQHIQDTLDKRSALGRPPTAALAPFADLKQHASLACGLTRTAHDELVPLRPAGWPAAAVALPDALAQLRQARAELELTSADVRAVVQALQPASS
jgi:hypothetical protein